MVPELIYLDDSLLVCKKPRGALSEGDGADAMPTLLGALLIERGEKNSSVFPVHRLDRETEGLMVYARTSSAAASLSRSIAEGALEKEYLARTEGIPPEGGELRDLLFFDRSRNKSFVVSRARRGVKEAILTYRRLSVDEHDSTALLRVRLLTGRTHQIRVQFASRGFPLVGDRRYGARSNAPLALRSVFLSFPHPSTGSPLTFEDA